MPAFLISSNLLITCLFVFQQNPLYILAPPLPLGSSPSELSVRLYGGLVLTKATA